MPGLRRLRQMVRKPILIVDDDPIARESIGNWLKEASYQVVIAESDEEAFELVKEQDFSVVVLDIKWPGKAGLTALKEMKVLKPQVKFIVMTASAFASPEVAVEAMKLGAVDYLVKPVVPSDLERLIQGTILNCQSEQ
jgi:DNA-binding NtrC family response regulator